MQTVNHDSEPTHRCGAAAPSKRHVPPSHYHHLRRTEVAQRPQCYVSVVTNHHGTGSPQVAWHATPAEVDLPIVDPLADGRHVRSQHRDSEVAEWKAEGNVGGQGALKGHHPIGVHLGKSKESMYKTSYRAWADSVTSLVIFYI